MISTLLGITSLCYTLIALQYLLNGQNGLGVAFLLYGLSNIALFFSGRGW